MEIIYKKEGYFIIKYKKRVFFKQYIIRSNKAFTFLYILHVLCKIGFLKLN